ncbi:MAG: glycosyltransferase [Nitrospinae bacterium]|nr:glycosyltransferase [Nitrospinota bacterium]
MRYIWDQYESYFGKGQAGLLTRTIMTWLRHPLQKWDVASSDGVHFFVANSQHVAKRIQKYYRRQAQVVYPPVDFHAFSFSSHDEGFYLMVTAFAPYKRVDLAIQACNRLGRSLKIVGAGQDERRLLRMAGPTIEMLGWQSDQRIRECYARCKALIFPGEEDFGIVPLEVMASGKPVIAYAKGGALETVVPLNPSRERKMPSDQGAPTGIFFYEQTVEALIEAILLFERDGDSFDAELIRCHVSSFDRTQFKERMRELINRCYKEFHVNRSC